MDRWRALIAGVDVSYVIVGGVVAAVLVIAGVLLLWRRRSGGRRVVAADTRDRSGQPASGLAAGLAKTRAGLRQRLLPLLGLDRLDSNAREELEAALLGADVGVRMTERLLRSIEGGDGRSGSTVRDRLKEEVLAILQAPQSSADSSGSASSSAPKPFVLMMVGVNGVGKTTTVGKLAARYVGAGRRTLMVAADTFRAAAIEQLAIWAERTGADFVRHQHGGDPGAVVHDGMRAALAREVEVVIVDTAGRLHTKSNLMEELRKVRRVMAREVPGAPHETLLVIDAVTGQNGLAQGRAFLEQLEVTGVVLTKLDGTAKGGVVVAIAGELGLPIRYVGMGERVEDLREFDAAAFASGLFETAD